jgi:flagellar biogenesis protein FliO
MRIFNKKISALLLAIILCSGVMLAESSRSGAASNAKSLFDNSGSFDANRPATSNIASKSNELFFKMMLMVLVVVALGVAMMYISRKILPKFAHLPAKRIQVVETVHIGPSKAVHLLKVGGQLILIGSTKENISRLSDITEPPGADL